MSLSTFFVDIDDKVVCHVSFELCQGIESCISGCSKVHLLMKNCLVTAAQQKQSEELGTRR